MNTIRICKADPTGDLEVASATLVIDDAIPPRPSWDTEDWQAMYREFYDVQAAKILVALKSLPGGTRHALLVALLKDKECLLRVQS